MSDAARKFFAGKSVQQALLLAASHYGLRSEEVRYREIEKRHGFTRTPKNVVIAVDPENPRRSAEEMAATQREQRVTPSPSSGIPGPERRPPLGREGREERGGGRGREERGARGSRDERGSRPGDRPRGPAAPRVAGWTRTEPLVGLPVAPAKRAGTLPRAEGVQAEAARHSIELLLAFVGIEAELDLYQAAERIEVELFGPDDRLLLAEEGRVLLAVEHLVPRMMRGLGSEPIPVRVDCDNFHMIREERLRDLAQRVAAEVRRTGRYEILDELDPSERRIIHVTLRDDPGVATESLGDGYYKRLKVMLTRPPEEGAAYEAEE